MTKGEAIYQFFNNFMTAYSASETPEDVSMPFLTYELSDGQYGDGECSITVNLWFHTDSEAIPNAKVLELSRLIGRGGIVLPYDNGAVWIKRGTPFSQSLSGQDNEDTKDIKRRYINLSAEYLSED